MCGRYTETWIDMRELKQRFNLKKIPAGLEQRYNIAPQQAVPAILNVSPDEPKMKYSLINARAEGIADKPTYRGLIRQKRCLIIADSFYEWKRAGRLRAPLEQVLDLLKPIDDKAVEVYPVSLLVNSPSNDSPEVIEPALKKS